MQQRPLLLREDQGKKPGRHVNKGRAAKALWDQESEPHHVGRRSGLGVQPGRCPRQQKLQAEEARVVLMPLPGSPLVFPKTQGENNSPLKSTNLLVPSWGSLPHCAGANKGSVSSWSPGTGSSPGLTTCSHPEPWLSQPIQGTEVCPAAQPAGLERERQAGAEPGCVGAGVLGVFLQLQPNTAQTDSRESSASISCARRGGSVCSLPCQESWLGKEQLLGMVGAHLVSCADNSS